MPYEAVLGTCFVLGAGLAAGAGVGLGCVGAGVVPEGFGGVDEPFWGTRAGAGVDGSFVCVTGVIVDVAPFCGGLGCEDGGALCEGGVFGDPVVPVAPCSTGAGGGALPVTQPFALAPYPGSRQQ